LNPYLVLDVFFTGSIGLTGIFHRSRVEMSERFKLAEGWSTFFLLMVMLISAATSISAAHWTDGLGHLSSAAFLGLVAGFLLAKSRFPSTIAHLFSLAYGAFTVTYLVGGMVDQPIWRDRVIALGERFVTWLTKATSGGTSRDSLMFVFLLASLFWLLGYISAWYTFRRPRLWRVLLPLSLTVLVNYYVYTDPRISTRSEASLVPFLAIFIMAALLYVVRTNVYLRELEWQDSHVSYSTELRIDFVRSGVILGTIALLVMTIAPGASASPNLGELWVGLQEVRNEVATTASRLFASLDARGRGVGNPFGSRAILGGPRDLGTEVLFDVRARDGRYWQAMVYDRYTGDDWISTDDHKLLLPPGEAISPNTWLMRREITQTVAIYLPSSTQLFAAPEPIRVPALSSRANITFDQGRVNSVSALYSQRTLRAGNVYQIVSAVSNAHPDALRQAGANYEDWIAQRYLQLPGSVTDRTRELAQEITAGHNNAFDKAQAIEQYLRENLRYDLAVPAPPEGQDFVDFVLFDLEAGYCDYYASSFVVLARSAGIPARIAMGYAQGEYDEDAKAFRVRANNGHSWPEVFFPEYGWIQFEPTVIIEPIAWPAAPAERTDNAGSTAGSSDSSGIPFGRDEPMMDELGLRPGSSSYFPDVETSRGPSLPLLVALGLLVIAGSGVAFVYWKAEKSGTSGLSLIERAYTRMWRLAEWLGVPSTPAQTPYERASALKTVVPEGEAPITYITDMYVVERFGRGNGNWDSGDAEAQWSLLRPHLWKTWLYRKLGRLKPDRHSRWRDLYESVADGRGTSGSRKQR
jgi:transglutaminase-like putative cysteine protease